MAEPYSLTQDILLGYDTDIHFSDGDLLRTSGIDLLEREIYKLLITDEGDWKASPTIGVSPEEFVGQPNSREIAEEIQTKISEGLALTVSPGRAVVRVIPTSIEEVLCLIDVYILDENVTTIPFSFDFTNGFIKLKKNDPRVTELISGPKLKINSPKNTPSYNKYWDRIRN